MLSKCGRSIFPKCVRSAQSSPLLYSVLAPPTCSPIPSAQQVGGFNVEAAVAAKQNHLSPPRRRHLAHQERRITETESYLAGTCVGLCACVCSPPMSYM